MEKEFIDSHGQRYERSEGGIGSQSWKLLYHWESPCLFPTSPYFSLGPFSPWLRAWLPESQGSPRKRAWAFNLHPQNPVAASGWPPWMVPFSLWPRTRWFGNWQPCLETHFWVGKRAVSWKKGRRHSLKKGGCWCRAGAVSTAEGKEDSLSWLQESVRWVWRVPSQRRQVQHEKMGCTSETGSVSQADWFHGAGWRVWTGLDWA